MKLTYAALQTIARLDPAVRVYFTVHGDTSAPYKYLYVHQHVTLPMLRAMIRKNFKVSCANAIGRGVDTLELKIAYAWQIERFVLNEPTKNREYINLIKVRPHIVHADARYVEILV